MGNFTEKIVFIHEFCIHSKYLLNNQKQIIFEEFQMPCSFAEIAVIINISSLQEHKRNKNFLTKSIYYDNQLHNFKKRPLFERYFPCSYGKMLPCLYFSKKQLIIFGYLQFRLQIIQMSKYVQYPNTFNM